MASPVSVIVNPKNSDDHCLFWLNSKAQLALEHRSELNPTVYDSYKNMGVSTGVIVNPSSLAAVVHSGLVTVYGITKPNVSGDSNFVSSLSPIFNPLRNDAAAVTTTPGLAACSSPAAGTDYVYFLQIASGGSSYALAEAQVRGNSDVTFNLFTDVYPSKDTNLAAVYSSASQDCFIFFTNTDKKKGIYYVNSGAQAQNLIRGTAGVAGASPLAVCSNVTNSSTGSILTIFLYYSDVNQKLTRIVGQVSGASQNIDWSSQQEVKNAPSLKSSTLMTAVSNGVKNFIYYIPDSASTFSPFIDPISKDMFTDPSQKSNSNGAGGDH